MGLYFINYNHVYLVRAYTKTGKGKSNITNDKIELL
jgi:hypothetical protein